MTRKLFVAATGQHCGKTTVALSIFHRLKAMGKKVGFVKPVGQVYVNYKGVDVDKDAAMMAEVFDIDEEDLPYLSPVLIKKGVTQDILSGNIDPKSFLEKIETAHRYFQSKYDWLIIEGTGHAAVGSVVGVSNGVSARIFNAPVLLVSGGGIGNVMDRVHSNSLVLGAEGVSVAAVMPNKIFPEKREKILYYLEQGLANNGHLLVPGMSFCRELAHPTFRQLATLFNEELQGDMGAAGRIILHTQVAAASIHRMSHILQDDSAMVIPGTRDEMIISMASMYGLEEFRNKIAGIIISGEPKVDELPTNILRASGIPYFKSNLTSMACIKKIQDFQTKLNAKDLAKIAFLKKLAEEQLDMDAVQNLFSE